MWVEPAPRPGVACEGKLAKMGQLTPFGIRFGELVCAHCLRWTSVGTNFWLLAPGELADPAAHIFSQAMELGVIVFIYLQMTLKD